MENKEEEYTLKYIAKSINATFYILATLITLYMNISLVNQVNIKHRQKTIINQNKVIINKLDSLKKIKFQENGEFRN